MSSESSGTAELQEFFDWCRKHNKTLLIIDHEGKKGGASFGSSGKERPLDAIIRLQKKGHVIHVMATKIRDESECDGSWLQYQIKTANSCNSICFDAHNHAVQSNDSAKALPVAENAPDAPLPEEPYSAGLDEAIIEYIKANPDQSQGKIAAALKDTNGKRRSTIHAHIKALREANMLSFWQNPPKTSTAEEHTSVSAEDD